MKIANTEMVIIYMIGKAINSYKISCASNPSCVALPPMLPCLKTPWILAPPSSIGLGLISTWGF
jgi:hypothetical protein